VLFVFGLGAIALGSWRILWALHVFGVIERPVPDQFPVKLPRWTKGGGREQRFCRPPRRTRRSRFRHCHCRASLLKGGRPGVIPEHWPRRESPSQRVAFTLIRSDTSGHSHVHVAHRIRRTACSCGSVDCGHRLDRLTRGIVLGFLSEGRSIPVPGKSSPGIRRQGEVAADPESLLPAQGSFRNTGPAEALLDWTG
jgi:hypothetical protein